MEIPIFQVDAFTDKVFGGNPACVVPLEEWLPNDLLLKIAQENAVAETAFFVKKKDKFHLRWFTPEIEMDLCGHATLATAHAIKEILKIPGENVIFESQSGELKVLAKEGMYTLDFPSRKPEDALMPPLLKESLNIQPQKVLKARDYVLVFSSEEEVRNIEINRLPFDQLELGTGGVIVTAEGNEVDFVSRFFTPRATVFEDPVTGSAHCSLVPYWSEKLNKKELRAKQVSSRGGELFCTFEGERVLISGNARTYSVGKFWLEN